MKQSLLVELNTEELPPRALKGRVTTQKAVPTTVATRPIGRTMMPSTTMAPYSGAVVR